MIRTTFNLKKESVSKIRNYARLLGMDLNIFMKHLLQYSVYHNALKEASFCRIRYQDRAPRSSWETMHITLDENDYELLLDVRKNYKVSISFFINEAVKLFLVKLLQLLTGKKHFPINYYNSYSIIKSSDKRGVVLWQIYWGLPESIP